MWISSMLCDLGFFKDLVAVGIRVSLFVHEERGTLEGELEDSYFSIIRPLYYVEFCQDSLI